MITSVHNSIHLTEMVTILLRRCVCPSGRIFKIWTHTIFSPYSMHLSKGISISATAATTINRVIPHMQPSHPMESIRHVHIQLYIIYRMTPSVQLGNPTSTAAVSDDDLHALGPVCALVIPLKGLQMVPSQLGKCVHHMGAQKGTDVLWNKSAISGAVLGPVRVVAHASTAA